MVYTETATIGGSIETGFTATVDTDLHGHTAPYTRASDSSTDGFTGSITFTTPGGTVTAQFGGSNDYSEDTHLGQATVDHGDVTITGSTDSAVAVGNGGQWGLFGKSVGLTYTDFGSWIINPCSNASDCTPAYAETTGGAAPGYSLTASMPTSGSAVYNGGATGLVQQPAGINSNNAALFYGTSQISASFQDGTVSGTITGIHAYVIDTGEDIGTVNNIAITGGTISGSTYNASTSVNGSAATAFDISGATGALTGGFYGPNAAETAGVFNLSGGTNSTSLIGSFGAKKTN